MDNGTSQAREAAGADRKALPPQPASEPPTLPVDTKLDCDDCELGPVVSADLTRVVPGSDRPLAERK